MELLFTVQSCALSIWFCVGKPERGRPRRGLCKPEVKALTGTSAKGFCSLRDAFFFVSDTDECLLLKELTRSEPSLYISKRMQQKLSARICKKFTCYTEAGYTLVSFSAL